MSTASPIVCAACGSSRLRASNAHGLVERAERALGGVHFHVCAACGARGTHRGHLGSRRVRNPPAPGRPPETRDLRAVRGRRMRQAAMVVIGSFLGVGLALLASHCGGS